MKKIEDLKVLSKERFFPRHHFYSNLAGRVFLLGEITHRMHMCIVHDVDDLFIGHECGIDILTLQNGKHIIINNLGIYAADFAEFADNYVRYLGDDLNLKGYAIIFRDDPEMRMGYDQEDGYEIIPSTIINDERLTRNIEQIEL